MKTFQLKIKKNSFLINIYFILIFLFLILPFILFGKDSIITIHDNLDSNIPWFKYIRDNAYYFNLNTPSTTLDNISTLYFAGDFSYKGFVYYIFDTYIAYNIIYISSLIFGYFSMKLLLLTILNNEKHINVIKIISSIYAVLPTFPGYRISVATLPFAFALFYFVYKCDNKNGLVLKYLLYSLIFPFFSSFDNVLFFALGYWLLLTIVLAIKEKKLNINLLLCFVLMSVGTIITNLRLFAMRLLYNEPLNRDIINIGLVNNVSICLKNVFIIFIKYFCNGHYHSYSLHKFILLPMLLILLIYTLVIFLHNDLVYVFSKFDYKIKTVLICFSVILFNCLIITLNDLNVLYNIFKILLPPLAGFSFARLYTFNNVLWYIIFTSILLIIFEKPLPENKFIVFALISIQLLIVLFSNNLYQDSWKSWKANIFNNDQYISYNDFFNEDLFAKIKTDICYNGEICIAVGYHPSVLMYNGFNTADGYISVYPMMDALKFKVLIQPELEVNDWANRYYTSWWGRRYIFNKDITFDPEKEVIDYKIDLRINVEYYKTYYTGKYVISRAEINNYKDFGLKFVNLYTHDNSIYKLWVYCT